MIDTVTITAPMTPVYRVQGLWSTYAMVVKPWYPVRQTLFYAGTDSDQPPGNCFQAVVASYLGWDLERVPHFITLPDWWNTFLQWAEDQCLVVRRQWTFDPGQLYIATGKSPRGDYLHSVLMRGYPAGDPLYKPDQGYFIHDPHPDDTYITDVGELLSLERRL